MTAIDDDRSATDIAVITVGGTIDKVYFDALSDYQVGDSVVERLLRIANVALPIRIDAAMRKDSLEMSDADRATVLARIVAAPERRIVITHGTDTMARTAEALRDLPDRTIVLTGALTPARFSESDAAFNLGMAIATVQTVAPGVWIVMNGTVFAAGQVEKDRANNRFVAVPPR